MQFYTEQHKHYCGIDLLSARWLILYKCLVQSPRRSHPFCQSRHGCASRYKKSGGKAA